MSVSPPRRRMAATARAALVWPPVPPPAMTIRTGLSRPDRLGAESEGRHGATRERLGFGEPRRLIGAHALAGGAAGTRIRGRAPVVVERHRAQEPDDEEREEKGQEAEAGASHAGLSVVRARDQ